MLTYGERTIYAVSYILYGTDSMILGTVTAITSIRILIRIFVLDSIFHQHDKLYKTIYNKQLSIKYGTRFKQSIENQYLKLVD